VLGAIIFAVHCKANPSRPADSGIIVIRGPQEHLVSALAWTWHHPATPRECIGTGGMAAFWTIERISGF
jgi:hypothetical protein